MNSRAVSTRKIWDVEKELAPLQVHSRNLNLYYLESLIWTSASDRCKPQAAIEPSKVKRLTVSTLSEAVVTAQASAMFDEPAMDLWL